MLAQRKMLFMVWILISGVTFLLLLGMSFRGRFEGISEIIAVWTKFFFPLVIPSLALMISTFVKQEESGADDVPGASPFLFKITLGLSVVYLLLPLAIILIAPFFNPLNPIQFYSSWSPMILGFQALPFSALAYFFYGDWIDVFFDQLS